MGLVGDDGGMYVEGEGRYVGGMHVREEGRYVCVCGGGEGYGIWVEEMIEVCKLYRRRGC